MKSATTLVAEDGLTVADAATEPPPGVFAVALSANAAGPGTVSAFLLGHTKFPNRAPNDAQYLVMTNDATLTNERKLQVASGLTATDGGAGGTLMITANSFVLDRLLAGLGVSGSVAETTLYSVTIGAGIMGTTKRVVLEAQLRLSGASTVADHYCTLRAKIDGVTVAEINPLTSQNDGTTSSVLTNRACEVRVIIQASAATNAQMIMIECGPAVAGIFTTATSIINLLNASSGRGTASVDMTVGRTFSLTARNSHAGAGDLVAIENAILKLE